MKKPKMKLLKIGEVVIDNELYPRLHVDWTTKARYYNALKSGNEFPPIIVALAEGKYILVDGAHRLQAYKEFKQTHIEAVILVGLTRQQIYLEAVKRNSVHGRQFTTQEITKIIITLEDWSVSEEVISKLVNIPVTELKDFVAKRSVLITDTQMLSPLKAPLKHLSLETEIPTEPNQRIFSSRSQVQILDMLINLLENGYIQDESDLIMTRLRKIYKLLGSYFVKEK